MNMTQIKIIYHLIAALTVLLNLVFCQKDIAAQSKSAGVIFSTSGAGLSYEHHTESDSFVCTDLTLLTHDFMWKQNQPQYLGATASFTWNIIFAERLRESGGRLIFFAGPGALAGFASDIKAPAGLIFGLKGRIGAECLFRNKITLSASLAPVIGVHLTSGKSNVRMNLYKTGLLHLIIPEIGLKYSF